MIGAEAGEVVATCKTAMVAGQPYFPTARCGHCASHDGARTSPTVLDCGTSSGIQRSDEMRMITTAIATAMILGGCASSRDRMYYEKPGVSEEQMRADEAACTRAALDTAGQRGAAFLSVDRDAVMDCMRARGYRISIGR
jgi:hypothetical protein